MGELVHISDSVQGIELLFRMSGGAVRAVVCRSALERFGATASPESWIAAYRANAAAIDTAIHRKAALNPGLTRIVLVDSDLDDVDPRIPAAKGATAPDTMNERKSG